MDVQFDQLAYLILFLLICLLLSAVCLICLHFITPWPKRESQLLKARYQYEIDGANDKPFPSLLTESASDRQFRRTEPAKYLTVVVPAMNEEVIVVDDGSRDRTSEEALAYRRNHPTFKQHENQAELFVLKLPQNFGKGGAVREGVLCARGQLILFADADGATTFSDFEKLEKKMHILCNGAESTEKEPIDWTHPAVVVGSRAHLEQDAIAQRSFFRTVLMFGFHALVWLFAVRTIKDTQCGFKLFSRSAAARLFPALHIERWAFDVELLYLTEQLNFSLAEVPVNWHEVACSKLDPLFASLQMGRDILLIWFRYTTGIWKLNDQ